MKRGESFYANLSPAVGSEMDKRRPILIVSNDANNRAANTVNRF
ncbi:type II toxin-antitoxin system PemK/MazF family toxin [Microcoleus sp. N3A4]